MSDLDERPRRRRGPLLALAGALAAIGALAVLIPALSGDPAPPAPDQPASRPPSAAREQGARFVGAGECVDIAGTEQEPVLRLLSCGPRAYQVLQRFDGTVDAEDACKDVPGYEYNYSYDSALDSLDYVLCLRQL